MKYKRNLFISFEGPEASGKSSQLRLLSKYFHLNNIPHLVTREPGGTTNAEKLRKIILNKKESITPTEEGERISREVLTQDLHNEELSVGGEPKGQGNIVQLGFYRIKRFNLIKIFRLFEKVGCFNNFTFQLILINLSAVNSNSIKDQS